MRFAFPFIYIMVQSFMLSSSKPFANSSPHELLQPKHQEEKALESTAIQSGHAASSDPIKNVSNESSGVLMMTSDIVTQSNTKLNDSISTEVYDNIPSDYEYDNTEDMEQEKHDMTIVKSTTVKDEKETRDNKAYATVPNTTFATEEYLFTGDDGDYPAIPEEATVSEVTYEEEESSSYLNTIDQSNESSTKAAEPTNDQSRNSATSKTFHLFAILLCIAAMYLN